MSNLPVVAPQKKLLRELRRWPRVTRDWVGALLAEDPITNLAELERRWIERGDLISVLKDTDLIRDVFANLIVRQLNLTLELITTHRKELESFFDPKCRTQVRSALYRHAHDFRLLLTATAVRGADPEDIAKNAREDMIVEYRKTHADDSSPFALVSESTAVRLLGQVSVAEAIIRLSGMKPGEYHAVKAYASKDGTDPEEIDLSNYDPRDYEGPHWWASNKLRAESLNAPFPTGISAQITRVEFEQIAYGSRPLITDGQALVAGMIGLGLSSEVLFLVKLRKLTEDWYIASYRVGVPQRSPRKGHNLYEKRGRLARVFVPRRLAEALLRIVRKWKRRTRVKQEAQQFLKALYTNLDLDSLGKTIAVHSAEWYCVPQVFTDAGNNPGTERYPKFSTRRSYIFTRDAVAIGLLPLTRLIIPEVTGPPAGSLSVSGWGAGLCLKTSEAKDLFSHLPKLLFETLPEDELHLVSHGHAVSGFAHLLYHLFTGLRNFGMKPPTREQIFQGHVGWIQQKGLPSLVYYPLPLRKILQQVSDYWRRWADKAKQVAPWVKLPLVENCYYKIPWSAHPKAQVTDDAIYHSDVLKSFLATPELQRWRFLHRNALRSWSNTFLRECGFLEVEVCYFHHHAPLMMHYTRRHRAEPPLFYEIREKLARVMAAEIGLPI